MKSICIPLALAAVLAMASSGACAAAGALHAMSESEMSAVYGRGLSDPTLGALGALTTQEQSSNGLSSADAQAAFGALASDGVQGLDRQLAEQHLQTAASGVQATVKLAQTLGVLDKTLLPIASAVTLPLMLVPFFGLPSAATLAALTQPKH